MCCSYDSSRLFSAYKSGAIAAVVDCSGNGSIMDLRGRCLLNLRAKRGGDATVIVEYADICDTGNNSVLHTFKHIPQGYSNMSKENMNSLQLEDGSIDTRQLTPEDIAFIQKMTSKNQSTVDIRTKTLLKIVEGGADSSEVIETSSPIPSNTGSVDGTDEIGVAEAKRINAGRNKSFDMIWVIEGLTIVFNPHSWEVQSNAIQ